MDIQILQSKAKEIFAKNNLSEWKLTFGNRRVFGYCSPSQKIICLNQHYAKTGDESHVIETLLHEVAHALTPGQGHNAVWRAVAKRLGCDPKATCADSHLLPPAKYQANCPVCNQLYQRQIFPKGKYVCPKKECKKSLLVFKEAA